MTAKKKPQTAAEAVVEKIRAKFGSDAAVLPGKGEARSSVKAIVPTGIHVLDHHIVGLGGLPVGRIVEVFGEEASGKTSLVLAMLGAVIRAGGVAIYVDTEHSFDEERARTFGVDLDKLVILQPSCLEEVVDEMICALSALPEASTEPMLLVHDSIAATPTRDELEGDIDRSKKFDKRAKLLSEACRKLPALAISRHASIVFVNQVREKIGVMFGDKYTTPGGHAVKFHASLRLQLFTGKSLKDDLGDHIGKAVTILAVKNRFAPPFRKAKVRLYFNRGWDNVWATISHAKDRKLIPDGAKYTRETYIEAAAKLGWKADDALTAQVLNAEEADGGDAGE